MLHINFVRPDLANILLTLTIRVTGLFKSIFTKIIMIPC